MLSGSLGKTAVVFPMAEKVDEILALGDPILRQRTALLNELLVSQRIPHAQMLQQRAASTKPFERAEGELSGSSGPATETSGGTKRSRHGHRRQSRFSAWLHPAF